MKAGNAPLIACFQRALYTSQQALSETCVTVSLDDVLTAITGKHSCLDIPKLIPILNTPFDPATFTMLHKACNTFPTHSILQLKRVTNDFHC